MKNRIRAAAIIIKNEKILLTKHVRSNEPDGGWWVPPGGGIDDSDISIISCAKRETWEETGYTVSINPTPVFIQEFLDKTHDALNVELFFSATVIDGELTTANNPDAGIETYEVRWFSIDELQPLTVFPLQLKQNFGRDNHEIYIGRKIG